jgi:hypothetical protein
MQVNHDNKVNLVFDDIPGNIFVPLASNFTNVPYGITTTHFGFCD